MIKTSLDLLWKVLDNLQKMFGNVCLAFSQLLENLRKSSDICGIFWKVVGNLQKINTNTIMYYHNLYKKIKQKAHGHLKI